MFFEILPCPHPGCWDVGELRQVHSAQGKPEPPGTKQTDSKAQTEEQRSGVKEMNAMSQQCLKSPSLTSSPTVPSTKPQRKTVLKSPPAAHRWSTRPVAVKTVKRHIKAHVLSLACKSRCSGKMRPRSCPVLRSGRPPGPGLDSPVCHSLQHSPLPPGH